MCSPLDALRWNRAYGSETLYAGDRDDGDTSSRFNRIRMTVPERRVSQLKWPPNVFSSGVRSVGHTVSLAHCLFT